MLRTLCICSYTFIPHQQNVGQNHTMVIANESFENVAKYKISRHMKSLNNTAEVPAMIQNGHLPNTSQKYYGLSQLRHIITMKQMSV